MAFPSRRAEAQYDRTEEQEGDTPRHRSRCMVRDALRMNMTPMIDIVFQLIIFFMLVSEFQNMEMEQITLPYALEGTEPTDVRARVVVNVSERGEIRLMRRLYSPDELEGALRESARLGPQEGGWPQLAVKVRADAECEYKHVQNVMVRCMRARIANVSFGVNHADRETLLEF
jgi:biopolymer transport protein ExbD